MRVHSSLAKVVCISFVCSLSECVGRIVVDHQLLSRILERQVSPYLGEIDMYIKACRDSSIFSSLGDQDSSIKQTSLNGSHEFFVGFAHDICLWIDKALPIIISLACDWSLMPISWRHGWGSDLLG